MKSVDFSPPFTLPHPLQKVIVLRVLELEKTWEIIGSQLSLQDGAVKGLQPAVSSKRTVYNPADRGSVITSSAWPFSET